MKDLKVFECFAGTGMQRRGFENAKVYNIVPSGVSEMDTNAIITYAVTQCGMDMEMVNNYEYPEREEMAEFLEKINLGYDFLKKKPYDWKKVARGKDAKMLLNRAWLACKLSNNYGDICTVDTIPETDMLTFSFPCTDLSVAGRQAGMVKGETRSGLVYEVIRIIKNTKEKEGRIPSFLLMENVDALVNKKNKPLYESINEEFSDLGYDCTYEIMNTKFTGIPQNRSRCYGLYIRKDLNNGKFTFPKKFDNGVRLKDVLLPDEEVEEKYYITSPKALELIKKIEDEEKNNAK